MMPYKDRNTTVRLPKNDDDFFDIVAGILQGNTLALLLLKLRLPYSNVNRSNVYIYIYIYIYVEKINL